jgi:hypothetical protein
MDTKSIGFFVSFVCFVCFVVLLFRDERHTPADALALDDSHD